MRTRYVGVLLAGLLLAGCSSSGTGTADREDAADSSSQPVATAPPCEELPERASPPDGEALPALTLACLGPGPDLSLDRLSGRPSLVNLWATWCEPCREEMPLLQDAYARHGEEIRFLGVDTQDRADAAGTFLGDLGVGYPHVVDPEGRLLTKLGIRGLPVTLAIDSSGRIVSQSVGELTAAELQQLIDDLLAS